MKTLSLIRHAKSSWDLDFIDVNRPLSARGINDANLLSNELLNYNLSVNAVFSSPANRALSTCEIFMENLKLPSNLLVVEESLYDFGGRHVVNFIQNIDNKHNDVFIFGHNHAFTALANSYGDLYIENVPTCGFVKIQFDSDSWKNLGKGHTKMTLFPKQLKTDEQ